VLFRSFGRDSLLDQPFPVAAKTGTSKNFRDNWTVGYTSRLVVAVWAGNFERSRELKKAESAAHGQEKRQYLLKLYVAGDEQNSLLARENLKSICDEYLQDLCRIEEVDVLTDFASALKDRVFVTPALILLKPGPRVTVIGNLGDKERVILALGLRIQHGK